MKFLSLLTGTALAAAAPLTSAQNGNVAILDIDRVARELKVDQAVAGELKAIESDLNLELNKMRNNLQITMNQMEAKAGQQRTKEIQQGLTAANQKLNQQFNQVKVKARTRLATERAKRINEFRDKIRPIAKAAAAERGLDVILTKSPQVFSFADAVDITDAVITGARAANLEADVPAAPAPATTDSGAKPEPDGGKAAENAGTPAPPSAGVETAPSPAPAPPVPAKP